MGANFQVVALGTGSKCLGENEVSLDGSLVHDSHAEVVAKRAFVTYLLHQLEKALQRAQQNVLPDACLTEDFIFNYDKTCQQFRLRNGIKFHFYSSHPPCGDATIAPKSTSEKLSDQNDCSFRNYTKRQKLEESSVKDIYRTGAKCIDENSVKDPINTSCLAAYHVLGAIRRKPGRGDPTQSLSCSDKMSKWMFVGLQGSILSAVIANNPIKVSSVTIGSDQFNVESLQRCLFDRFLEGCKGPLSQIPLLHTNVKFQFGRTHAGQVKSINDAGLFACSNSIVHSQCDDELVLHEVMVDGRKQGIIKKYFGTPKARVNICRLNLANRYARLLRQIHLGCDTRECTFCDFLKDEMVNYRDLKLRCQNQSSWYKNHIEKFVKFVPGFHEARQSRRSRIDNFYI